MSKTDDFCFTLPQDVLFQFLSKLPTRTLLQLRCVSKSFIPLISHPDFLKLHLSSVSTATAGSQPHQLLYYESTDYTKVYFSFHHSQSFALCKNFETPFKSVNGYLRLVGSSGGVVCLFDTNYFNYVGTVILWNPFIGKFKILPCLQGFDCSYMAVGFGYDPTTADFKVVKILYGCASELGFQPEALIYEVKVGSWRSTGHVVPCFIPKYWSSNVFVNRVVHWLAYKKPEFNDQPNCIMGFDVVKEIFNVMELPRNLRQNCKELRLSPLGDEKSLALFVSYRENMGETWDVWLMNNYGKVESWTRKYSIMLDPVCVPLKIVNGGTLAAINDEKLILLDVETEKVTDLAVRGLPLSFYTAGYVPTLALLDIGQQLVETTVLEEQRKEATPSFRNA